jgi:putative transposase
VFRGFRYKLAPTPEQENTFRQYAGVCRFLYNLALEQRETYWRLAKANGVLLGFTQQCRELTQLRAEVDWIEAVPRDCEEKALRHLDRAFSAFFAGRGRYPRYRRRGEDTFEFRARDISVRRINAKWSAIRLPKIGWVKYRDTRPMRGVARNVTLSLDPLGWHVSIGCEIEHEPAANDMPAVGIDRGVAITLALSTGEMLSVPAGLADIERRHRRAQRVLARRQRGSNRRARALRRVAALAARRARIRRDWHHKATSSIADRFGVVVLEALNVPKMTTAGRGASKRGLNRSILNQSWGAFAGLLTYKLKERGGTLVLVDPAYTSQTCSECGTIDKESRESQAVFRCRHCGHEAHADVNAALNVLRLGSTQPLRVEATGYGASEARTVNHALAA